MQPEEVREAVTMELREMARIDQKIQALKALCTHNWVFERDPSGNNDSGYYCNACGAWRKTKPE